MDINWTSIFLGIGSTMFGIILYQSREIQNTVDKEVDENRKQVADVHREFESLKSTLPRQYVSRDEIDETDRQIAEMHREFVSLRSSLPLQYVLRDDFLRSISALDTKIDRMSTEVGSISKNIAKLTGGET